MPLLRSRSWATVVIIALAGCATNAPRKRPYNQWLPWLCPATRSPNTILAFLSPRAQVSLGTTWRRKVGSRNPLRPDTRPRNIIWRSFTPMALACLETIRKRPNGSGRPVKPYRARDSISLLFTPRARAFPRIGLNRRKWYEKAAADGIATHTWPWARFTKKVRVFQSMARAQTSTTNRRSACSRKFRAGSGSFSLQSRAHVQRGARHSEEYKEIGPVDPEAADLGGARAQHLLGTMHIRGEEVSKSTVLGLKFWNLAAAQAHPDAQLDLGMLYSRGESVPQDHINAVAFWGQAAIGGSVQAMHNLGWAFDNGMASPMTMPKR